MSRAGRILRVDLSDQKIEKEPTSSYVRDWMGGDGIAAKILTDEVPPGATAYDPESLLTINTGILTGTLRGSKSTVFNRNPCMIHNVLSTAGMGGGFPAELKFAGYDNLIIKGKADKPVYLFINNDKVEIRDAAHLWGQDTYQTQTSIKNELDDPDVQVACIGPGGENLVTYSLIYHDINATAAKSGGGGVMGSKNLKAIAVRGTKPIKLADPKKFADLFNDYFYATFTEKLTADHWTKKSMITCIDQENDIDIIMWGGSVENLNCPPIPKGNSMQDFVDKYFVGNSGCAFCPEQCYPRLNVPGVGAGAALCAMPVEWQARFKIWNPLFWWKCALLSDRLGIDASSTCNIISWMMEMYERGIITAADTDGLKMEWGNEEVVLAMIEKIGRKEGCGELYGQGPLAASLKLGKSAKRLARHTKGYPLLNYFLWSGGSLGMAVGMGGAGTVADPAGVENAGQIIEEILKVHPPAPGMDAEMIHELADSLRSAKTEHMCGDPDAWKLFEDDGETIRTTNKALMLLAFEDQTALADFCGACDQSTGAGPRAIGAMRDFWQEMSDFVHAATGEQWPAERMQETVKRVRLLETGYDYLCGLRREDEQMSEDTYGEANTRQWGRRTFTTREAMEKMKTEYYQLRGRDPETGAPRREELEKLGLKDMADRLAKLDLTPRPVEAEEVSEIPSKRKSRARSARTRS